MNAEESEATDPQLRLLLETSYHALESGLSLTDLAETDLQLTVGQPVFLSSL